MSTQATNKAELKQKVLTAIVKGGANPKDAKSQVEEHFDYALRTYKGSTVKEYAKIIISL